LNTHCLKIFEVLLSTFFPVLISGQNIFPGSRGMGTQSLGAYGGQDLPHIVVVDNLRDSGPGSFRYAVSRPFPRIVVFAISGDISLKSPIVVRVPYIHVAGQTAPGKGIAVWGQPFIIESHDVLVQDVHFRLGINHEKQSDCATVRGTALRTYNVVFDRCSFALGLDETLTILNAGPGITISNSIIGYSLDAFDHSCGLLVLNSFNVSLIQNVLAFNGDRNPTVRGDSRKVEIVNNLIYNSASHAIYLGSRGPRNYPVDVILAGNHYITGPDNMNRYLLSVHANVADSLNVFWADNSTFHKKQLTNDFVSQLFDKSNCFQPVKEYPFQASVDSVLPSCRLDSFLLSFAGAYSQVRDPIDSLLIVNIREQSGSIIRSEDQLNITLNLPVEKREVKIPEKPHFKEKNGFTKLQNYLQQMLEGKR
jgi:hypothetical protein